MIKKLKTTFIILAFLSLFILRFMVATGNMGSSSASTFI